MYSASLLATRSHEIGNTIRVSNSTPKSSALPPAALLRGGNVTVTARLDGAVPETLVIVVHDTGPGVSQVELRGGRELGVGLSNVERRLACHYGDARRWGG